MTDDDKIEAIVELGNSPEVIKLCEPQICFPLTLQAWMVKRTLKALEVLGEEEGTEGSGWVSHGGISGIE
jgi:hypothetical protein